MHGKGQAWVLENFIEDGSTHQGKRKHAKEAIVKERLDGTGRPGLSAASKSGVDSSMHSVRGGETVPCRKGKNVETMTRLRLRHRR
jgi:hypothetical protein